MQIANHNLFEFSVGMYLWMMVERNTKYEWMNETLRRIRIYKGEEMNVQGIGERKLFEAKWSGEYMFTFNGDPCLNSKQYPSIHSYFPIRRKRLTIWWKS